MMNKQLWKLRGLNFSYYATTGVLNPFFAVIFGGARLFVFANRAVDDDRTVHHDIRPTDVGIYQRSLSNVEAHYFFACGA